MKYLITGLGNPGKAYQNTRHNIGFDVVDALCSELNGQWTPDHHGQLATVKYKGRTLLLLKPETYMNLSGKAVRYWLQKEKIATDFSVTICDDLNLEPGKLRLRPKGSPGGHNGLKSIAELLGTDEYPRLRMGIGNDYAKGKQAEFVLGKWKPDEEADRTLMVRKAIETLFTFVTIGLEKAMTLAGQP
jgi:PTH1 family peptidyl-tRNA hydrolase